MASGFQYTCSQFISALQFPSLNLQVQEVTRHFKETASYHESTVPVSPASSSSSHTLKLFLSGLECGEVGAVEASCWGLRRLHETDQLSVSELIAQLLSKLASCLHTLPVVSLLGDLLLILNTANRYNLHINQHPLALAFSSCPDSVLSTILSLFSRDGAPRALLALWPCLTQILIDPQLTAQRPHVITTLAEIISSPRIPAGVPYSLTRLLLLAAVYESECPIRTRLMHSLLDLAISNPDTLPLSEIVSRCYSTLLTAASPAACLPLLHKLKRLLLLQPRLLSCGTIHWLCLSLLRTEIVQWAPQLADIAELVLDTCRDNSVSDVTRDSRSLLLFSLLGAQLNLERLRPEVSSRCSGLLSSLLTGAKRVERSASRLRDLSTGDVLSGVTTGELSLFSSLSSLLLVCPLSLVTVWCQDTLHSLSSSTADSQPPLALCCIVSSLLTELSSPSLPPDQLPEARLILRLLLRVISRIMATASNIGPPLIALLLLTMDRCASPADTLLTLQTLASLSTHPACVILVLRSLLSLADTPPLRSAALRALVSLWKQHDAVYPHVKQLIQAQCPSAEWSVARSLSVLDICSTRPAVHGEEMLPLVRGLTESREHSLLVCVGLSALTSLAAAETVTFSSSLHLLASAVGTQAPAAWEPAVAEKATHLLRLCPKLLDPSAAPDQELVFRCLQQLMTLLAHTHEQARAAAVSALSEFTLQEFFLVDPFSASVRMELSIPDCLDLSPDRRSRSQCAALFSRVLRIEFLSPNSCRALGQLLSRWLGEELTAGSAVFPREHRQEVERGEAALRSSGKALTDCLPKLKHLKDIPDAFLLSPHQAVSLLFVGRELWWYSESPQKLLLQFLRLLSRSLSYPAALATLSDVNTFLLVVDGVKLFMRDALSSYRPDPSDHCSPIESLFHLLDSITCQENPQGAMWLMVGLALNVRELHSSRLQAAIQSLINALLTASAHLLSASTDSYSLTDESGTMYFSRNLTPLSGVAYLGLGVLAGVMGAHLKQKFSSNTLSLFIRAWHASQQPSPQLDVLYALSLSSILRAKRSYRLEEGPAARKLNELSERCTLQIQQGSYPSQYACMLLIDDAILIRSKQQELLNALTATESADRQLESSALACSVLTCRLYSMREISLQECDEVISLFLKLARDQPSIFPHTAVCVILSHTACYGHVASQLLIGKTLSQLRTLLQQSSDGNVTSLLQAILAVFGTFQPLIGALPPPTPAHYSILQQGVRAFLDLTSPRVDRENRFSSLMVLLGFVHSRYSHFSESIRTPSSSQFLPDNTLLTPLFGFLEESLQCGTISREYQLEKFVTIFEELCRLKKPLPTYPWCNLVTCVQRNTELDAIHGSLLKLIFKIQSHATEQELERITFLFDHWLLDTTLDNSKVGINCRKILAHNLSSVFDLCTDQFRFNYLLLFLIQDPSLSALILEGLVKLMEEKETTIIQQLKRDVIVFALKAILTGSMEDHICCPDAIPPLVKCLSHLSPADRNKLIPEEGEFFLLLRSHIFNNTREYHWIRPCITFLINLPPLTLTVSSHYVHAILTQLSLVRALPSEVVSQVCLEILTLVKPKLKSKALSSVEEQSTLMFNSVLILSLINPEISRMSAMLIQSQLSHLNDTHSGIEISLCLSEMTNTLISISSVNQQERRYVPVLKRIYECLLLFFQLLEEETYTSEQCALLFSLLPHLRSVDEVVSVKPWAMMGQAIFIQSNLLLKLSCRH